MKIDMHVHTEKHSACAVMSPEAMARSAIGQGLEGVVITEHDYLWSQVEVQALQAQFPTLKILRGIEVSTAEGHALAYGVSKAVTKTMYPKMPLAELTHIVHTAGGLVVLAHPARYQDTIPDAVYEANIDGIEVLSMNVRSYMEAAIQELCKVLNKPCIAGSDAHAPEFFGYYATDFHHPIETERDLVDAIKTQSFAIYCNHDHVRDYNEHLQVQVTQMIQLLQENMLTSEEIKAQYRFSHSFQRGVREGKDQHLCVW